MIRTMRYKWNKYNIKCKVILQQEKDIRISRLVARQTKSASVAL